MKSQSKNLDSSLKSWIKFLNSDSNGESPTDKWLTIPEMCNLLRCSEPTIYRKLKSGAINYSKPAGVMVWLSDLAQYVIETTTIK
jgi:excisionase family DNA binding protein